MDKNTRTTLGTRRSNAVMARVEVLELLGYSKPPVGKIESDELANKISNATNLDSEKTVEVCKALANCINNTESLTSYLSKVMDSDEESTKAEIHRENMLADAVNIRSYKKWGHQLIRWFLGGVSVVVVYSILVWLSIWTDNSRCEPYEEKKVVCPLPDVKLTIPVKDFFMNKR